MKLFFKLLFLINFKLKFKSSLSQINFHNTKYWARDISEAGVSLRKRRGFKLKHRARTLNQAIRIQISSFSLLHAFLRTAPFQNSRQPCLLKWRSFTI